MGYNVGIALLGGTTPMVVAWLLSRTGHHLAPGAILLPSAARHGITREFSAVRFR